MAAMDWLKHNTKLMVGAAIIITGASLLTGCESEESNDLAKAQQCLDRVSSSNFAAADACMSYVSKYDTQQANILKCSIKFVAGGLTTAKIANAFKAIAQEGTYGANKEAALIATPALSDVNKATDAQAYCLRTGLKGLIYLSNLAVIGSYMADAVGSGVFDPSTGNAPDATDLGNMITECTDFVSGNCNHAAMGAAVENLADSYCSGVNADAEVCSKINDAVVGAAGDPVLVSKQLFCLLNGQTFNGTICM